LQQERWTGDSAVDDNRLFRLVKQLEHPDYRALPESELARHEQTIARLSAGDQLPDIVEQLLAADESSDWWKDAMNNLRGGCPVSAWLVWTQLKKGQQMSLKDIFRMELGMATRCTQRPDLREGIRARLIDRDQSPVWSFSSVAEVPEDVVESHFSPVSGIAWGGGLVL
jgi:enoyl-CoA hydratase/carnithine racemase